MRSITSEAGSIRIIPIFYYVAHDPAEACWDGFAEVWFESRAAADAAFASEPFASLIRADRPKFVEDQLIFFVDETTVIESPR